MTLLVIIEIVIGIVLAIGIAIAAFRAFIKGRDSRPGLLIGSSTAAVALLIICLVCTGLQMNNSRNAAAAAEFEEHEQVRSESVNSEKKSLEAEKKAAKAAENKKAEKEEEIDTEAERAKARAEFLAGYFGSEAKAEEKKAESVSSDNSNNSYNLENIEAAAFTVGVPVYTADDTEAEEEYPAMDNLMADSGWSESYYDSSSDYTGDYYGSESGDNSGDYYDYSESGTDYYEDSSYEAEDSADNFQDYSGYVDESYAPEEDNYEPETDYTYTEPEVPDYTYEEPDYSYEEPSDTYEEPSEEAYVWDGSVLSPASGVNYGPLGLETYYNMDMSGVVSIMRSLGYSEEEYPYYVREDGCKMLGGYVMVAANFSQFSRGDIVQCSLGPAIVCDTGAGGFNWLDIATSW